MIDQEQLATLREICNVFKDTMVRVHLKDHDENSFVLKIMKETATKNYEIELTFALSGAEIKLVQLSRGGTMFNRLFRTEPSQIYELTQKSQ